LRRVISVAVVLGLLGGLGVTGPRGGLRLLALGLLRLIVVIQRVGDAEFGRAAPDQRLRAGDVAVTGAGEDRRVVEIAGILYGIRPVGKRLMLVRELPAGGGVDVALVNHGLGLVQRVDHLRVRDDDGVGGRVVGYGGDERLHGVGNRAG